jgi:UDP-N-acetylglucosamine enolpyruvyl transferase
MALACTLDGASMIVENMFESRFQHATQWSHWRGHFT